MSCGSETENFEGQKCPLCNQSRSLQDIFCIGCGYSFQVDDQQEVSENAKTNITHPNDEEVPEIEPSQISDHQFMTERLKELENIQFCINLLQQDEFRPDQTVETLKNELSKRIDVIGTELTNALTNSLIEIKDRSTYEKTPERIEYFLGFIDREFQTNKETLRNSSVDALLNRLRPGIKDNLYRPLEVSSSENANVSKEQLDEQIQVHHPKPFLPQVNWNNLLTAISSENAMSAFLSFGVLLIALSSLVIVVSLWSQFSWIIKQSVFVLQMVGFISAGHIVKERLNLRISGLALISIGAIWSLFNAGIVVYEFIGSGGVQVIPGLGLPIDLPILGWLTISIISLPVWLILTHIYRGHLLIQGSVGIIGICLCLSLISMGLSWYWSLLALTVESLALIVFWNRLKHIYNYISLPLIWTAHVLATITTIALLFVWLMEGSGYPFIAAMTGLSILLYLAMQQLQFSWYRYPIVGLVSVAFVLLVLQSGFVEIEYFDLILTLTGALSFILGKVCKQFRLPSLESKHQFLNPFNLAMLLFLIAALLWPDINYWARSVTAFSTTIIIMTVAYFWKDEPWPWVPLIPLTVLVYVLFEASRLNDIWLVSFFASFSFFGMVIGTAINKIRNLSIPWHIWSSLLIFVAFGYSFAGKEFEMEHNFITISILLGCYSGLVIKLPLSGGQYISSLIYKIDNYKDSRFLKESIHPQLIIRWWSVILSTIAIIIFPFAISNSLTSIGYFGQSISRDAYITISWAIIILLISVKLLEKVSKIHRIGGFVATGIIAPIGYLLAVSASDPIAIFVVSYAIVSISILYRIFTSIYLFSWVATACSAIAIISTFDLFAPLSQEFIAPWIAIIALMYLLSGWFLRKREIDTYPALLASTIILFSIIINLATWETTAGMFCFLLAAVYFIFLGLLIFQQIVSCETCYQRQNRTTDKFCMGCGSKYIGGSYRKLLSFTDTKYLSLGSAIFISLGTSLVVTAFFTLLKLLGYSSDFQAYGLMIVASGLLIIGILFDSGFKAIYMRGLQVVATIVMICSIAVASIFGNDTSLIVIYLWTSIFAMVFRIRFNHLLPIIFSLFFLVLGTYEILEMIKFSNILETTLWCSFSLTLFGIGYYIERKTPHDAVSFYIFSCVLVVVSVWVSLFDQQSMLISLGFLILSSISIGILIEKERIHALKGIFGVLQDLGIDSPYTPKTISVLISITIASVVTPIWTITFLTNFDTFLLVTHGALVISLHSLGFILLAALFARVKVLYILPLQLSSIITASIAPMIAIDYEIYRMATIWISTTSFAFSALIFKRFYWIYAASIAGHIAVISTLEIDYFGFNLHEKGLILGLFGAIFSVFVLSIVKRLKLSIHTGKQFDYKTLPLMILIALDLGIGIIIAGWNDWANWEALTLGITAMLLTTGLSIVLKIHYLTYLSTILMTVNVGFIAGMISDGPTIRAVAWSLQGLFMWWIGVGISKGILPESIKFWETPFKTSGNRLCWFATVYVIIVLSLGLTGTIGIDIASAQISMVIAILGLLYLGMSLYHRNHIFSYIAAAFLIISWYIQLVDRNIPYIQLYCIPAGIYLLTLSYFEKKKGKYGNGIPIMLAFLAICILIGSAFIQSLISEPEIFYFILVAIEAVLLVVLGTLSKSRFYFISGILAFILNIGYQTTSILASLGTAVFALVIGIMIVTLVIILERFREKLLASARLLSTDENEWTW